MVYYYEIDFKKGKFILTENNVDEHSAFLEAFEVDVLKKTLENKFFNSDLKRLDYLRGVLDMDDENGIDVGSYYSLVKAVVNQSFRTNFKIKEPKFYVHVLPIYEGYLNISEETPNAFYFDTKNQWKGNQVKFTKEEIEELKKYPQLKGINFDECLERVEEDN